jgi:histidinol-phosphate aminotransferase
MRPDWTKSKYTDIKYNLSNNICIDTQLVLPTIDTAILNTYPDEYPIYIALSQHHGIPVENIAIGLGLGELLQRIYIHLDLGKVTILSPTWPMAEIFLKIENVDHRMLTYSDFNQFNFNLLLTETTDSIYLANPNGVNGTMFTREQIMLLLEKYNLVILDEAYMDFADQSMIDQLLNNPNLLILKTFSKSIASPGMRLGYCLGSYEIISKLQLVRPSCVAHGSTVVLTPLALKEMPNHITRMLATKKYLESNYNTIPSHSNYVLFQTIPQIKDNVIVKEVHPGIYRMALFNQELLTEIFL